MATNLAALKTQGDQPPAKKPKTIFDFLMDDKVKTAIGAVAGQYMTPERYLRLAINAVKKTPRLLECDPQTVLGSFMASAALALEPNTVLGQAYLIPYAIRGKLDNGEWGVVGYECQFQIGYRGFITLAHRSPSILTLEAEAIHKGDHFDHLKGSRSFLEYRKALVARGELIGAFAFSKLDGGVEAATVLTLEDLHKIRSKSETYQSLLRGLDKANMKDWEKKKAEQKLADTPWVLWEDDMAAKSAIKKHAKQLPMQPGDALKAAQALDAADDGKTIDMGEFTDPDKLRQVMEDGELHEGGDNGIPSLTNEQGGESLEMPTQRQREKVDVRAFNEERRANAKANAQDVAATDQATKGDAPFEVTAIDVEASINRAKSPDELDLVADQIRQLPPKDQPRMNKLYRARHAELEGASAPAANTRQASFSME